MNIEWKEGNLFCNYNSFQNLKFPLFDCAKVNLISCHKEKKSHSIAFCIHFQKIFDWGMLFQIVSSIWSGTKKFPLTYCAKRNYISSFSKFFPINLMPMKAYEIAFCIHLWWILNEKMLLKVAPSIRSETKFFLSWCEKINFKSSSKEQFFINWTAYRIINIGTIYLLSNEHSFWNYKFSLSYCAKMNFSSAPEVQFLINFIESHIGTNEITF